MLQPRYQRCSDQRLRQSRWHGMALGESGAIAFFADRAAFRPASQPPFPTPAASSRTGALLAGCSPLRPPGGTSPERTSGEHPIPHRSERHLPSHPFLGYSDARRARCSRETALHAPLPGPQMRVPRRALNPPIEQARRTRSNRSSTGVCLRLISSRASRARAPFSSVTMPALHYHPAL